MGILVHIEFNHMKSCIEKIIFFQLQSTIQIEVHAFKVTKDPLPFSSDVQTIGCRPLTQPDSRSSWVVQ